MVSGLFVCAEFDSRTGCWEHCVIFIWYSGRKYKDSLILILIDKYPYVPVQSRTHDDDERAKANKVFPACLQYQQS